MLSRTFPAAKKNPTCSNALDRRSSTSGYSIIDLPAQPGCPSSSHPTINEFKYLESARAVQENFFVKFAFRGKKVVRGILVHESPY